eukprot:3812909-Prymnesium_polylepis.1
MTGRCSCNHATGHTTRQVEDPCMWDCPCMGRAAQVMSLPCDFHSRCSQCPRHTTSMQHLAHHRHSSRQMHRCTSRCTRQPTWATWAARPTVDRRSVGRSPCSQCPRHTTSMQHLAHRRRSS